MNDRKPTASVESAHDVQRAIAAQGATPCNRNALDASPVVVLPDIRSTSDISDAAWLDQAGFFEAVRRLQQRCRACDAQAFLLLIDNERIDTRGPLHSDGAASVIGDSVWRILRAARAARADVARFTSSRFGMAGLNHRPDLAIDLARRCIAVNDRYTRSANSAGVATRVSVGMALSAPGFIETPGDMVNRAEQALALALERGGARAVDFADLLGQGTMQGQVDLSSPLSATRELNWTRQQLREAYLASTRVLVNAVEAKDPMTRSHSVRVSAYAENLAMRTGATPAQIESIRVASVLHDVGKIGVPDAILQKPGPLTPEEFEIVKQHPETGYRILEHARYLQSELPLILHHHEHYDGSGYPHGLAGADIPYGARIVAVADAIDAMLSGRTYKEPCTPDQVRSELERYADMQWDPAIVNAAAEWIEQEPEAFTPDQSHPTA